ncbi:uncharacterized protein TM35_001001000, partial [Trypanosoma theileri]
MSPTVQYTVKENNTTTTSSGAAVPIHTGLILLSTLALFCTAEAMVLISLLGMGTGDGVVVGASVVVFSEIGVVVELVSCESAGVTLLPAFDTALSLC